MSDAKTQLAWALERLAQSQSSKLDKLRLLSSLQALDEDAEPPLALARLTASLGMEPPQWMQTPDPALLPALGFTEQQGWVVVLEHTAQGSWHVINKDGAHMLATDVLKDRCALVSTRMLRVAFGFGALLGRSQDDGTFISHVYSALRLYKRDLIEAGLASAFIGLLALVTSLFSMQVYDRIIPTRGEATLLILASGVLLTILIELAMKLVRAKVMDNVVVGLDNRLGREIFSRLLHLRLDQMPASVGSLAGQIRGYEQVRGFYTASTLFTLIDLPMGFLFIALIWAMGHPALAVVPLVMGAVALWLGLSMRSKVMRQAQEGAQYANLKTGLLVETLEGIETIKAGSGGWKFLSRWIGVTHHTIHNDLKTRNLTDSVTYLSAAVQQISYAGLVVVGAWAVMQGHMTMGALIACSILGGRILVPIMALPGLLVQHAHAAAALESIEKLYKLKVDNHDVERPLAPDRLSGHYQLTDVKFAYADNPPAIVLPALEIRPGERVVVLGTIGAGKSSLLRLLSGMYQPIQGRVLIDGLDLSHVHRQVISQHVGYLQQDHRLFQGTLRENLLIGLPDPGDAVIFKALQRTGMDRFVTTHPKGLDRLINEGGKGLSGGQRQLVAFTRLVLTSPDILLLDEPTATMDDEQERRCLQVLVEEANKGKTMVIVTHKASLIPLATRIVVLAGSTVALDGPRDAVLAKLQKPHPQTAPAANPRPIADVPECAAIPTT